MWCSGMAIAKIHVVRNNRSFRDVLRTGLRMPAHLMDLPEPARSGLHL